jgi:hypothetical protein
MESFDSPWKASLEVFFRDFLRLFFPEIERELSWERGVEFLDKELEQVARESEVGSRTADKLIKVWRKTGEEAWLLVHVEVQAQPDSKFPERMYVYNNRIYDKYRRQVVSVGVLADERESWRPCEFTYSLFGCRVLLEFPTVKLLDYDMDSLSRSENPFAVLVRAHRTVQMTRQDERARYEGKFRLLTELSERGFSRQESVELLRLIHGLVGLSEPLEMELRRDLEAAGMAYMSTYERLIGEEAREKGLVEGKLEGKLEGKRSSILTLLELRFETVPESVERTLNSINDEESLTTLLGRAAMCQTLEEFQEAFRELASTEAEGESEQQEA